MTIEDPKVFTRPWQMSMLLYRRKEPDVRLLDHEPFLLMKGGAGRTRTRKVRQLDREG